MATDADPRFPLERSLNYVAAWTALGAVLGFVAWGLCDWLFPNLAADTSKWGWWGAGLGGTVGLVLTISNLILY